MRSTPENRRFSKWTGSTGCPAAGSVMDDFFHGQLAARGGLAEARRLTGGEETPQAMDDPRRGLGA